MYHLVLSHAKMGLIGFVGGMIFVTVVTTWDGSCQLLRSSWWSMPVMCIDLAVLIAVAVFLAFAYSADARKAAAPQPRRLRRGGKVWEGMTHRRLSGCQRPDLG